MPPIHGVPNSDLVGESNGEGVGGVVGKMASVFLGDSDGANENDSVFMGGLVGQDESVGDVMGLLVGNSEEENVATFWTILTVGTAVRSLKAKKSRALVPLVNVGVVLGESEW